MAPPLILRPAGTGRAQYQAELEGCNDARTGMPARILAGAMCVQRFDDSLNSAIHITYRISLRSSSMPEPRDPLLKVLTYSVQKTQRGHENSRVCWVSGGPPGGRGRGRAARRSNDIGSVHDGLGVLQLCNDPSAGSPTETLLRLLLPLN